MTQNALNICLMSERRIQLVQYDNSKFRNPRSMQRWIVSEGRTPLLKLIITSSIKELKEITAPFLDHLHCPILYVLAELIEIVGEIVDARAEHLDFLVRPLTPAERKHQLIIVREKEAKRRRGKETTHPAGESAIGCSCIVISASLLNAAPASVKISPT
jgi:hypothetical protein